MPDLLSKPILDIALGSPGAEDTDEIAAALVRLGYIDRGRGEDGIGRLMVRESAPDVRTIHVHILPEESAWIRRHLAFRDALRGSPALRRRYAEVKRALAQRHPFDRTPYTTGKGAAVREILDRVGWSDDCPSGTTAEGG